MQISVRSGWFNFIVYLLKINLIDWQNMHGCLCIYWYLYAYICTYTHVLSVYASLITDFQVWRLLLTLHTALTARKLYKKVLLLITDLCLHFYIQMMFLCLSSFFSFILSSNASIRERDILRGQASWAEALGVQVTAFPFLQLSQMPSARTVVGTPEAVKPWGEMAPASVSDINLICHF